MLRKHLTFVFVALFLSISVFGTTGIADDWPKKPIKIIIPWPASNDPTTAVANAMAPHMSDELGVPVKVVNQSGGRAVLATDELANSRPDGHTMGLISVGPMVTQVLMGNTPYKNQDLRPLGIAWSSPFTMAARADAPYDNLEELSEFGKKEDLRLAHWGLGAVPTLIAMNVAKIGGFEWKETAYEDLNPLLVTQEDADVITFSIPGLEDYIESGDMKILACMLPDRLPQYPDVPTVEEQGFGEAYSIWFGGFVPAGTPDHIVKKLSETFFKVMELPEIQDKIETMGVVPSPKGPEEARKQMDRELDEYEEIMKELNLID